MPALPATDVASSPAITGQRLASSHGSLPFVQATPTAETGVERAERSGRSLYRTIVADPPWKQEMIGQFKDSRNWSWRPGRNDDLPYGTMDVEEICALPVGDFAERGAHLWLWTTNRFLEAGFQVMRAWGFKYLAPITWVKPSGCGAWFVGRTQTVLFGYRDKCEFNRERYRPTVFESGNPRAHSAKPEQAYKLIEAVSDPARLEVFARPWMPLMPKRPGWDVWGNEVASDVDFRVGGGRGSENLPPAEEKYNDASERLRGENPTTTP